LVGLTGADIGTTQLLIPYTGKNTSGGLMASNTYKLYGRANSGSLAVQIALEEIGAPYEMVWVSRAPEEVATLRQINPTGKVPALVLPDGTPVFESAAILIHLAHAHPAANLAPPAGTTAHARFLQWMLFLSSNVYETVLRSSYPERYSTIGQAAANEIKQQAAADYVRHLELIHGALSPYVLGETLSAADPYLYMLTAWYPGDLAALHARLPKLAQHAELLHRRAATVKAEQAHTGD
jgi:glutathione S-transferase